MEFPGVAVAGSGGSVLGLGQTLTCPATYDYVRALSRHKRGRSCQRQRIFFHESADSWKTWEHI